MGKCKDCLHQEVCEMYYFMLAEYKGLDIEVAKERIAESKINDGDCEYFYDNSKLRVELPCKVGTTIYYHVLGSIIRSKIVEFIVNENRVLFRTSHGNMYNTSKIGEHFFFTREEVEKTLKK